MNEKEFLASLGVGLTEESASALLVYNTHQQLDVLTRLQLDCQQKLMALIGTNKQAEKKELRAIISYLEACEKLTLEL